MVHSYRPRASAAPGAARHHAALQSKTKAPYKVVFEQVTEKRRKLLTVLSFNADAPPGYTFIPAGDPQITNRCKQVAREYGHKVYIVSTSKHKHRGILSHEVHRIGHHFPSLVVEKACMSLGISLTQSGHVLPTQTVQHTAHHEPGPRNRVTMNQLGGNAPLEVDVPQAILDTQAREAIKDLFPKIPEKDLHQIIRRAFKKGKDRVGTAIELPLSRRVQLAVVAHIRHVYTNYDQLLRIESYQNARAAIEKPCLNLLAQWRSDDDDDPNAMEEILREVIVIDDDAEENNGNNSPLETMLPTNRESSIEIISRDEFVNELQMREVDYGSPARLVHRDRSHSPELDDRHLVRYRHSERPRSSHHRTNYPPTLDLTDIHRNRWQEALHRHRTNPVPIYPNNHGPRIRNLASPPGAPISYTEPEPRRLHLDDQSKKYLPLGSAGYIQSQDPAHFVLRNKDNLLNAGPESANRIHHPNPQRLREVFVPSQDHLYDGRSRVMEPVNLRPGKRIDYYDQYPRTQEPRIIPSEENFRHVRDEITQQEPFDRTHNQQPRHLVQRTSEQILPSMEGKLLEANNSKRDYNTSNNRPSNSVKELDRYSRAEDVESRVIHVDGEFETHNNKRRRVEEIKTLPSERLRQQYDDDLYPERAVLVSLGKDDRWRESHQQLSPSVRLSTKNPFLRQQPNAYVQSVDPMRHEDREIFPQLLSPEASGSSGGPRTDYGRAEIFHPSSQLPRNVHFGNEQEKKGYECSAFAVPRNASLSSSFRDDHMLLQSSHVLINSSRQADDHVAREYPNEEFINPINHRVVEQQQKEQELQSDFERLTTGATYHQTHFDPSYVGFKNYRAALMPSNWDSTQVPSRGEARTGVFLRELPDDKHILPEDTRLSTPKPRLLHRVSNSPRNNADGFLRYPAEVRDLRTWVPVREKPEVKSWQPSPRLTNDSRTGYPHTNTIISTHARAGEFVGGRAGRRDLSYFGVPGWEASDAREIIVID